MSYKCLNEGRGTRSREACDGGGGGRKIKISEKESYAFKKSPNENLGG